MKKEIEMVTLEPAQEVKTTSNNSRRDLSMGFYLWNLNLYLVSILTFEPFIIKAALYLVINSFVFKTMFGITRVKRTLMWLAILWILYIIYFDGLIIQHFILIMTSIINIGYYIILSNGKPSKRVDG